VVIDWHEWADAEAAVRWDDALRALPEHSVYQAYGWGVYRKRAGWQVRRGTILVDGTAAGMAQCLVREIPVARLAIVWVPGGPAGSPAARYALAAALRRRYARWALALRANVVAEMTTAEGDGWRAAGWRPAGVRLGHPLTFLVDLAPDEHRRRAALHGNWRHNLRRGEQREPAVDVWPPSASLGPVDALCREMVDRKRLAADAHLDDLDALRGALGPQLTLMVTWERPGKISAVRGFGRLGERAYDLVAASSPAARSSYTGYVLMWRLLALARAQGAHAYDMSGADSYRAPGVYNFKRGLGGRAVPLVGEWDWATSRLLRGGLSLAIRAARGAGGTGAA
jgi:hypothetical protein